MKCCSSFKYKKQIDMNEITINIDVPFPTQREADIAYQVLRVDAEPSNSGVTKILKLENNILKAVFRGREARKVRVGVASFFDNILLVTEMMDEFGPPKEKYSYY